MVPAMAQDLNAPTEADLEQLAGLAGAAQRGSEAEPYLIDPRGLTPGMAALVVRPDTPERVAAIVRYCSDNQIGVVPHGGGTGLVGGQTMSEGLAPARELR